MTFCSVDGCRNEAKKAGRCWSHVKSAQRSQGASRPLLQRPKTPLELLTEAALTYAEADDDGDFRRALDNLRQSANRYARRVSQEGPSLEEIDALRGELRDMQQKLGRPRRLTREEIHAAVSRVGGLSRAARELGISVRTVQRAMRWIESHTS